MKSPFTVALFASLLASTALAAPATSEETKAKVLIDAPRYDPAAHAAAEKEKLENGALGDEEIVVMEEMTVQEKSLRRLEEESLFKRGAWDKELKKRELSEFDRMLLNRYTAKLTAGPVSLGIGGAQSAADRAREEYSARKNREFQERANNFSDVLKTTDEKEAAELRTLMLDTAKSGQGMESSAKPGNWR